MTSLYSIFQFNTCNPFKCLKWINCSVILFNIFWKASKSWIPYSYICSAWIIWKPQISNCCALLLGSINLLVKWFAFQYEDFEVLSQTAREVWLAEQCSAFETQIQALSREREKDHFLEELYRKLKQVTRRWQSWNHRSFGGVTSRGCVNVLKPKPK